MTLSTELADLDAFLGGPDFDSDPVAAVDTTDAIVKLRILARIRREIDEHNIIYAAELERLLDWHERRIQTLTRQEAWATSSLAQFHAAMLRDNPKATTLDLPGGKLVARKQQPAWEFGPEFVTWAMSSAPDLVRIPEPVPAADKAAAKKALTITGESGEGVPVVDAQGELVPGVAVTFRGVKHTVELS